MFVYRIMIFVFFSNFYEVLAQYVFKIHDKYNKLCLPMQMFYHYSRSLCHIEIIIFWQIN